MTDLLPSWNEGEAKRSIEQFITAAATEGDGFIEPADRIAVFDNDGTLWIEQPLPVQLDFILRALAKAAQDDASLTQQEPYKAIFTRDLSFFEGVGQQEPDAIRALEEALARTWLGATSEQFEAQVSTYLEEQRSERFGVAYPELVYKPMLEAVRSARGERLPGVCVLGRRTRLHAGHRRVRVGIPREHVIGTAPTYRYEDGVIKRGDKVLGGLALGPGKPEHIFAYAGRMPAFAGGNADVDIEMLESATFAMLVVHDDADREFAYTKAAERSVAAAPTTAGPW